MPFEKLTRWLREPNKTTDRATPLRLNALEDRITPAATLQDINGSLSGAGSKPSTILGQSDDGRYIIFSSAATDLVIGQSDVPNTNDLFWRDLQTGSTRMVTALPGITETTYDYASTQLAPQSFALQAVVEGGLVQPTFSKAVISGDGRYVAFSSTVNIGRLVTTVTDRIDTDYATAKYAPFTNNNAVVDLANTLDVFRWEAQTGVIQLASRTVPSGSTGMQDVGFGRYGSSDNPAISFDGSYVGFVSRVDAWYTSSKGKPTAFGAGIIVDDSSTNDVFVTNFDVNAPPRITIMSAVTTRGTSNANDADFIRAYGHLGGADGVQVDPLGRYLANDFGGNLSIVAVAPVQPSGFFTGGSGGLFNFGGFDNPGAGYGSSILFSLTDFIGNGQTPQNNVNGSRANEAYKFNILTSLIGNLTAQHLTSTGTSKVGGGGVFIGGTGVTTSTTLVNGFIVSGSAQNVIVARQNPAASLVSTSNVASNNGDFSPTPQAFDANRQDLYYVRTDVTNQSVKVASTSKLPQIINNVDVNQYSISPNGKYFVYAQVTGLQADGLTEKNQVFYRTYNPTATSIITAPVTISVGLDGQPAAAGGQSPRVSRNGRFVTYSSITMANLLVAGNPNDANNKSDVFIRDLFATQVAGLFVGNTRLLSINAAGTGTDSLGTSDNAFVGSVLEDASNGISPSLDADSVGRVAFNSTALTIDQTLPILHGGKSIFLQDLPIDGLPPTVPPTTATRVAVVSGGREAAITQVSFTATGTVNFGQRLTPYPGFLGEIRTASADVDGDGTADLVVAPGPGTGPRVIVISGVNEKRILDFFAFEPEFTGGVNIAARDINGDGVAEIVVGADRRGGARVRVFDVSNPANYVNSVQTNYKTMVDFFAYNVEFRGGVRVAIGDVNGDGINDVVTGAGTGGGPRVSVFNGADIRNGNLNRFVDFFAMETTLRNGVNVAVEDMNNDGFAEIITGSGAGGAPRVRVFEALSVIARPSSPDLLYDFFAGSTDSRAGIRVAAKNVDGDGTADIVTGEGFGRESRVRTFAGARFSAPLTPAEINNNFVVFSDFNSFNGSWVG